MAPPVQPPVRLFPPAPFLSFVEFDKLKRAVATAASDLAGARGGTSPTFRLAIIDLEGAAPLKWGGHNADTMDFIASEAKVIALYGAFALRDMVRRLHDLRVLRAFKANALHALGLGEPWAQRGTLFDQLRAEVDPVLLAQAHPMLRGVKQSEKLPRYADMFTATRDVRPDFTGSYTTHLRAMIVPSSNSGAMSCIHGVGYAYLNGAMQDLGLLKGNTGPWLGGDFIGKYTYARVDSANDQGVAQAGTALGMAKLMAIIMRQAVMMEEDSFKHMATLMADAVRGPDTPFLARNPPDFNDDRLRFPLDKITHIKLGLADLKARNGGFSVGSEVMRLKGLLKPNREYAVAYQNLDWRVFGSADVAFVIRRALDIYET